MDAQHASEEGASAPSGVSSPGGGDMQPKRGISLDSRPSQAKKKRRKSASSGDGVSSSVRKQERSSQGKTPDRKPKRKKGTASRQWKVMAAIVGVCALAAFLFTLVQNMSVISVANLVLFGNPDPYVSPAKKARISKEFRDMVQKEFGGPKLR